MSVLAGMWNFDGQAVDPERLVRMGKAAAEYGPDSERVHLGVSFGMLYRALHTTSESRYEQQPQISSSGSVITWDGRLDNRNHLISQLTGHLGSDRSDAAIVGAGYDRWGQDCFAKLVGDWALAIWHPSNNELILARDYIGVRQLFYYPLLQRVVWCNHLAPLVSCGDKFTVSGEYIAGYLVFYPDAHLTPFCEIRSVVPGTFLRIRPGYITTHRYWSFNAKRNLRYKTDSEYEEQYRHLFRSAVRRRLRSDSHVLADLSGGFDSSAIVCMADDICAKEQPATETVDTLSFYDSLEPEEDDLVYFRRVEERRGKNGICVDLRASGDSLAFHHPAFAARPGFGLRKEVSAAIAEIVRQGRYRVVLSGSGGDELNGQALNPRLQLADLFLQARFRDFAKQLTAWSVLIRKRPWIQLLCQTLLELAPLQIRSALSNQAAVEPWINQRFARKYRLSFRQIEAVEGFKFARPRVRDAVQTLITLSNRLTNTGPFVIEKRYPYLDQDLVEFLMSIPFDQLLRPGDRRSLMKRALADLLPKEILVRKGKSGLARYFCIAVEKHWAEIDTAFSTPVTARLGYVNRERIYEALMNVKHGNITSRVSDLLNALSLEFWLRDAIAQGVIADTGPLESVPMACLSESRA